MKKTGALQVGVSSALDREHIVMHPNEGFELGLMRVTHPVRLCRNLDLEHYLKGEEGDSDGILLQLQNDCPAATILVSRLLHRLLGEPKRVVVLFDGERLFAHTVP